jgi:hypothetical protein
MNTSYFSALCDDTGMFQHAVHAIPDRAHGYCIDDNARALLVAIGLRTGGKSVLPDVMATRFCAFIQHGWNPDLRRFRNFMGFDRSWLEDLGSEDSHGRTLWALGACALAEHRSAHRDWASGLFAAALPIVEQFHSPRAFAFTLLGLDAYCAAMPTDKTAARLRRVLAARLMQLLAAVETKDWAWFEEGLAYDNARLPEALLLTGVALNDVAMVAAGHKTLDWLATVQSGPSGRFRPVGSQSFGDVRMAPRPFDQQPLEAAAMIAACLAAHTADSDQRWVKRAQHAFDWFHGANDLGLPLVDPADGSCRDGLHPDRVNQNRGAESVVSYLLACLDMRRLAELTETVPVRLRA